MIAGENAAYLQERLSYLIMYLVGMPLIKHYEVT